MKSLPEWSLRGPSREGWPWTCDVACPDEKRPGFSVAVVLLASQWSTALEASLRSILWQAGTGTQVLIPLSLQGSWPSCVRTLKSGETTGERLNAGVEEAKTEWLTWLRAGDLWMPDTLSTMSSLAAECPKADFLTGRCMIVPAVGAQSHPLAPDPTATDGPSIVMDEHTGWPPAAFFRRRLLRAGGEFDATFDWLVACEWHWRGMAESRIGAWVTTPAVIATMTLPHHGDAAQKRALDLERERLWKKVGFEMPAAFQKFFEENARAA